MASNAHRVAESSQRKEDRSLPQVGNGEADRQFRFVYLAPADIQIARVDRQAIAYFCSALARLGARVELVTLKVRLLAAVREPQH